VSKSRSSKQWLRHHRSDAYVKLAKADGYRSRAAYKLIEINDRDRILLKGSVVVELGAAPGGWSQVVVDLIGAAGRLLMIDLLPIEPLRGAAYIQGDFAADGTLAQVRAWLGSTRADVLLSDMAPNLSGIKSNDQARSLALVELAVVGCREVLRPGGCLLAKVFQGPDVGDLVAELAKSFRHVVVRKPGASRSNSGEIYLLAKEFGYERGT
jgi:23S rRNA (uridine2552-2'-O)-methyltransferase